MKKIEHFYFAILALSTGTLTSAPMYSVTDLGPYSNLAGRDDGGPQAINRLGKVAASNVSGGAYRAFFYDGGWTNLGTLGGNTSVAAGLNNGDRVVGFSQNASGTRRGFIWTPSATDGVPGNPRMKEIGTFGGPESAAFGINASDQVTGYAQTSANDHAFRYLNGALTDVGKLLPNGLPNSYGFAINGSGHIAGTAYNSTFKAGQAFFYDGASAVALGALTGNFSSGLAINDADHIVGYWTTANNEDRVFYYHDGVMTDLGSLGGDFAYALAINNHEVAVGGSFVDTKNTVYHAFLAVSNSLTDLNSLLDSSGSGWTLVEARAINDAGQIAGVGKLGGADHMFLLNPPTTSVRMTGIRTSGADALVSFTTMSGATYDLLGRANIASGSWSNIVTGISGTGNTVTVTDAGALARPRMFYRVKMNSP